MFGIKFTKFEANTYVIHYKNGRIKKEGKGLSFWYYAPSSSIVAVPIGSNDLQFIFNGITSDFQNITVQGQITYRITDPKSLADLLDLTVDKKGNYLKNDLDKVGQRLTNEAQTATNAFLEAVSLKEALRSAREIEDRLKEGLEKSEVISMLGIEPLGVNVVAVKATPEMVRALEAEAREALLQDADEALFARRKFAVEQERKIKESELNTQIAVEEKQKQIREAKMMAEIAVEQKKHQIREMKMEADISVEEKRKELIRMQAENSRSEADAKGYALEVMLRPYKNIDWKILMALGKGGGAANNIALAFRELAENSAKIENLNISPDLLNSLTKQRNR